MTVKLGDEDSTEFGKSISKEIISVEATEKPSDAASFSVDEATRKHAKETRVVLDQGHIPCDASISCRSRLCSLCIYIPQERCHTDITLHNE